MKQVKFSVFMVLLLSIPVSLITWRALDDLAAPPVKKPPEYRHVSIWRDPDDAKVYVFGILAPYGHVTLEVGSVYSIRVEADNRRKLEYDFWVTEGKYQVIDARPYDLTGHWQGTKK